MPGSTSTTAAAADAAPPATLDLEIRGTTCGHCASGARVERVAVDAAPPTLEPGTAPPTA